MGQMEGGWGEGGGSTVLDPWVENTVQGTEFFLSRFRAVPYGPAFQKNISDVCVPKTKFLLRPGVILESISFRRHSRAPT